MSKQQIAGTALIVVGLGLLAIKRMDAGTFSDTFLKGGADDGNSGIQAENEQLRDKGE